MQLIFFDISAGRERKQGNGDGAAEEFDGVVGGNRGVAEGERR